MMGRINIIVMTPSTTTVVSREARNSELERRSRRHLWARAVFGPLLVLAAALGLVYVSYRSVDTVRRGSGTAWRLLIIVSWWPYATLVDVILSYVTLSLPLAPVAVRNALVVVYTAGLLFLFMPASAAVFFYGHAPAIVALGFSLAAALAGLMAFWILA